jgi:hypothetical protein
MRLTSLLTTAALVGIMTVWDAPLKAINPQLVQASAQEMKDSTGLTVQQKLAKITQLGVQSGGAGMVVNLYNKANNVTFAYCATYDVVVAVKQGKVAKFLAREVK